MSREQALEFLQFTWPTWPTPGSTPHTHPHTLDRPGIVRSLRSNGQVEVAFEDGDVAVLPVDLVFPIEVYNQMFNSPDDSGGDMFSSLLGAVAMDDAVEGADFD